MNAPVLVLNTNAERDQGSRAQFGNIAAAKAVADIFSEYSSSPVFTNDVEIYLLLPPPPFVRAAISLTSPSTTS